MLTLICGLPRAGKTTYSQQYDNVIHLDTSGAYHGVVHKLKRMDGDVVVEGVYSKKNERTNLIRSYPTDKYKCIWLNTPDEVRRARHGWDKYCDKPFEVPTFDEGWDEIIMVRGEDDGECNSQQG